MNLQIKPKFFTIIGVIISIVFVTFFSYVYLTSPNLQAFARILAFDYANSSLEKLIPNFSLPVGPVSSYAQAYGGSALNGRNYDVEAGIQEMQWLNATVADHQLAIINSQNSVAYSSDNS